MQTVFQLNERRKKKYVYILRYVCERAIKIEPTEYGEFSQIGSYCWITAWIMEHKRRRDFFLFPCAIVIICVIFLFHISALARNSLLVCVCIYNLFKFHMLE